ncbi:MAG: hypothetical protein AAB347_00150 [Bacteroidota bacterium]
MKRTYTVIGCSIPGVQHSLTQGHPVNLTRKQTQQIYNENRGTGLIIFIKTFKVLKTLKVYRALGVAEGRTKETNIEKREDEKLDDCNIVRTNSFQWIYPDGNHPNEIVGKQQKS